MKRRRKERRGGGGVGRRKGGGRRRGKEETWEDEEEREWEDEEEKRKKRRRGERSRGMKKERLKEGEKGGKQPSDLPESGGRPKGEWFLLFYFVSLVFGRLCSRRLPFDLCDCLSLCFIYSFLLVIYPCLSWVHHFSSSFISGFFM